MEVLTYKLGGNSFPIIIQQSNKKHFIKLRAGPGGECSLLSARFGNGVGRLIGLNTQKPQWIWLTNSLNFKHIYIEARHLIEKSFGINIGFEYIENVQEINLNDLTKVDKERFSNIYLLDVLMLNVDRTTENLNLLKLDNNEILITDFDSSLIFNEIFNGLNPSKNKRILQALKSNPFYKNVKELNVECFIKALNQLDFKKMIGEIPEELLNSREKEIFLTNINNKKNSGWDLKNILIEIDKTTLELESDKKLRLHKNKQKFINSMNSTHNKVYKK